MADVIFTIVFLIFLNSQWVFFANSSLTYIISRFLLQSYKMQNYIFIGYLIGS